MLDFVVSSVPVADSISFFTNITYNPREEFQTVHLKTFRGC